MSASLKGPDPSQKLVSLRDVLAYNVRAYRVQKLLSQEQLGFAAGLDRTFVSQVERARINVSLDNIEKLAAALDVPAANLLQWPEPRTAQHS
jgi:transcriptional regulator with XRE-family HTH domain